MSSQKPKAYVPKKERQLKQNLDFKKAEMIPWTDKQKKLFNLLTRKQKFNLDEISRSGLDVLQPVDNKCMFIEGCAGTGKSVCAMYCALKLLNEKKVDKIVYIRSTVGSSSTGVGWLKGSLLDKISPYHGVMNTSLATLLNEPQIKYLMDGGFVEGESTELLRGKTYHNTIVICDEVQNFTYDELKTVISRIGEYSKIWFVYDPKQSDLPRHHKDDIVNFSNIFKGDDLKNKMNSIGHYQFTKEDIVRSGFCKYVMGEIEDYEESLGDQRKQLEFEKRNNFEKVNKPEPLPRDYNVEDWSPS